MLLLASKPFFHFSLDDVFDCLIELRDQNISLLEQPLFKYLNVLHEKYDISIGLHLFYQKRINGKIRSLAEIPDIRSELQNSGADKWLFFGPHALDYETAPYNQTPSEQESVYKKIIKEIDRFAGKNNFTEYIRLHYYTESFELSDFFHENGINGLFTTDREALSHRMGEKEKKDLIQKGFTSYKNLLFIRTQFRLEFYTQKNKSEIKKEISDNLKKYNFIVFYTHENEMSNEKIRSSLENFLEILNSKLIPSVKRP